MITLRYTPTRGGAKGESLYPHKHDDGKYVASMTRFEKDYVRVNTIEELIDYLNRGFSVRMSNPQRSRAPSLISPSSIKIVNL